MVPADNLRLLVLRRGIPPPHWPSRELSILRGNRVHGPVHCLATRLVDPEYVRGSLTLILRQRQSKTNTQNPCKFEQPTCKSTTADRAFDRINQPPFHGHCLRCFSPALAHRAARCFVGAAARLFQGCLLSLSLREDLTSLLPGCHRGISWGGLGTHRVTHQKAGIQKVQLSSNQISLLMLPQEKNGAPLLSQGEPQANGYVPASPPPTCPSYQGPRHVSPEQPHWLLCSVPLCIATS